MKTKFKHSYHRLRAYIGRPKLVKQITPVLIDENSQCQNPIFIVGAHRSGTSLLRRILNSHSQIACPPETYFLEHFAAMIRDRLTYAGFRGLGFEEQEVLAQIRTWSSRFHETFRLANGKARWADKTPQYVTILPELELIFGPNTRFVIIFRHPLDIVYSQWKRGWRFGNYHPDILLNNSYYVADSINKILEFMNKHRDICHIIHYERLITTTELELKKLFAFLDESWEEDVLKYHEKQHGFGTEDPVIRGTKGFINNSGNWHALPEDKLEQALAILNEVMDLIGYNTESDLPCS